MPWCKFPLRVSYQAIAIGGVTRSYTRHKSTMCSIVQRSQASETELVQAGVKRCGKSAELLS